MRDLQHIRTLAVALRENLVQCTAKPDVDPVHNTRTGTRRLQATIESLLRDMPEEGAGEALRDAVRPMMQVLKRIRRAAGPVRDLDVHRKLLSKLAKRALDTGRAREHPEDLPVAAGVADSEALGHSQARLRMTPLEQQAEDLDAWLKHRRAVLAQDLETRAAAVLPRFDKRVAGLEAALRAKGMRRRKAKPLAVVALENFARLATEMQALHVGNLHDFRKGAKKARYVAELAASADREAAQVGETLKKLQDEIGDWHDWLVLAEEAHTALGDKPLALVGLIEAERDRHFAAAMQMATRLRGRLMGEWLAVGREKRVRPRVGPRKRADPARGK